MCIMLYLIDLIDFNKYMKIQNVMLAGSSLVSKGSQAQSFTVKDCERFTL